MALRESPYVDLDTGTVVMPPMELSRQRSAPRTLDDMIDLFNCRVDVWQLGPAVQILKQIEISPSCSVWRHAAYALLGIVFTYFEMIGKSLNPASQPRGTSKVDFNYGFCDVYPAFGSTSVGHTDQELPDVAAFRDRARNGLYHLGYTKGNLFIHNDSSLATDDFFVDRREPEPKYLVNPHQMTRTIVGHFPSFMGRLRDSSGQSDDLRSRFRRFFVEFHGLR